MNYYPWLVFFHVIMAAAFMMNLIFMQLVFEGAMRHFSAGTEKKAAAAFMQRYWHPIVDIIIVIVGITGLILGVINFEQIITTPRMFIKVGLGGIALGCAYANHFVFRGWKRRLAARPERSALLDKLQKISKILARIALITGVVAALFGWYINYFGM